MARVPLPAALVRGHLFPYWEGRAAALAAALEAALDNPEGDCEGAEAASLAAEAEAALLMCERLSGVLEAGEATP